MARKQFILVAGVNYKNFSGKSLVECCRNRVRVLSRMHAGSALRFIIFDFRDGKVETTDVLRAGEAKVVSVKKFKPFTASDYIVYQNGTAYFDGSTSGKMSVTDIYETVQKIGTDTPGELVEMSWFYEESNFITDQVKLTGAYEYGWYGNRPATDLDPNFERDFISPSMSKKDLERFHAAFHSGGYVWLWNERDKGVMPEFHLKIVDLALAKFSKLTDDTLIDISSFTDDEYVSFNMYLRHPAAGAIYRDFDQVPFSFLNYFLDRNFRRSYAYQLSVAIGIKVFGVINPVLPEPEAEGPLALFHITGKSKRYHQFFVKHLGFTLDPEDRGYAGYPAQALPEPPYPNRDKIIDTIKEQSKPAPEPEPELPPARPEVLRPTHPFFRLEEYSKHFVFVAGVDYQSAGVNFFERCLSRVDLYLANDQTRKTVLFQILDFASGLVTFVEVKYDQSGEVDSSAFKGKTILPSVIKTTDDLTGFEPVKAGTDYKEGEDAFGYSQQFFKGKPGVMTMAEVYRRIFEIGKKSPGRLVELSFFCHGDESGPRPLNYPLSISEETEEEEKDDEKKTEKRKKKEYNEDLYLDPSPFCDFFLLMDDTDRKNFTAAFHPQGYSWAWGCESDPELRKLLKAVLESKEYKARGLTDETIITLKNPTPRLRLFARRVGNLVSAKTVPPLKIKMPFGRLLHFFGAIVKSSYMYQLARISGQPVFAGLPGVDSEEEKGVQYPLFAIPPAFTKYSNFYREHFGFDFDPEVRGYGKYIPDFPWDDTDLAGVRIETEVLDEVQAFPPE